MKKWIIPIAVVAIGFCGIVSAQGSNESEITSKDADKREAHDRPLGGVSIKLPAPATPPAQPPTPSPEPPTTNPTPPSEGEDIPPTETPPNPPPPEDPPTYYGEPVEGRFAFLLDASGSMHGSRIATVRAETTGTIGDLTEDDEFDCVAYGGQFGASVDYQKYMWGALLPATDGNKSAAISWVNGSSTNPGGMTPTYACLKKACATYPSDLTKMFLLTDGYPNITGGSSQILADFPTWWAKFEDAELICICIGGVSTAQSFMQQLAALAGGTYIAA